MSESSPRRNRRSRITYIFLTSCSRAVLAHGAVRSWDLNLADEGDGGALGHVVRQQAERFFFAAGLDGPPDRVPASAARGQGRPVAKRAVVSFERGEHHAALSWFVPVVEQIAGHESNVLPRRRPDI